MAAPASTGSCSKGEAGRSCVALSDPTQRPQTSLLSYSISGGISQRLPSFKVGGTSPPPVDGGEGKGVHSSGTASEAESHVL